MNLTKSLEASAFRCVTNCVRDWMENWLSLRERMRQLRCSRCEWTTRKVDQMRFPQTTTTGTTSAATSSRAQRTPAGFSIHLATQTSKVGVWVTTQSNLATLSSPPSTRTTNSESMVKMREVITLTATHTRCQSKALKTTQDANLNSQKCPVRSECILVC